MFSAFAVRMRGMGCFGIAGGFALVVWVFPDSPMLSPVKRIGLPVMLRGGDVTGVLLLPGLPVVALGRCRVLPPVWARGFLCCRGVGDCSPSSRSISRQTSLDFSQ